MNLQDLRHWQWALIGLLLGGIMGAARYYWALDPELGNYDRSIDERLFEDRLATPNPATSARPYFHSLVILPYGSGEMLLAKAMEQDLSVYPKADGKGTVRFIEKTVIVKPETGIYYPGRYPELADKTSQVRVTFRRTPDKQKLKELAGRGFKQTEQISANVFVGTIDPAKAHIIYKLQDVESVVAIDGKNTIHGFLGKLQAKHPDFKISYQYAWWAAPRMQLALWSAGGVVVIGGIWPFLVNILAFGRLMHPPREKPEIDLSKVRSRAVAKGSEKPTVDTAALDAQIAQMEQNLEGFLKPEGDPEDAAHQPAGPAAVRKLTGGPLEAVHVPSDQDKKKDYAGEFYPTVAHAPKKPGE